MLRSAALLLPLLWQLLPSVTLVALASRPCNLQSRFFTQQNSAAAGRQLLAEEIQCESARGSFGPGSTFIGTFGAFVDQPLCGWIKLDNGFVSTTLCQAPDVPLCTRLSMFYKDGGRDGIFTDSVTEPDGCSDGGGGGNPQTGCYATIETLDNGATWSVRPREGQSCKPDTTFNGWRDDLLAGFNQGQWPGNCITASAVQGQPRCVMITQACKDNGQGNSHVQFQCESCQDDAGPDPCTCGVEELVLPDLPDVEKCNPQNPAAIIGAVQATPFQADDAPMPDTCTASTPAATVVVGATQQVTGEPCRFKISVTANLTDACGVEKTDERTYTWIEDTQAPNITAPGTINLQCNAPAVTAAMLSANSSVTDNCGPTPFTNATYDISDQGLDASGCTRTWQGVIKAKDSCQDVEKQVFYVHKEDRTAPTIGVPNPRSVCCGTAPPSGVASDNCDGTDIDTSIAGMPQAVLPRPSNQSCAGVLKVNYTATDECGNPAWREVTIAECMCGQTAVLGPRPNVGSVTASSLPADTPWSLLVADSDNNRWGWQLKLGAQGQSEPGVFWAGAGQSIRAKGVDAGDITITRTAGCNVEFTFALHAETTFSISDLHIGVQLGSPIASTAWGNRPYTTPTTWTLPITGRSLPALKMATTTVNKRTTVTWSPASAADCTASTPVYVVVHAGDVKGCPDLAPPPMIDRPPHSALAAVAAGGPRILYECPMRTECMHALHSVSP